MDVDRRPGWPLVLAVSTGVWTFAVLLQTVAAYADDLRRGTPSGLTTLLAQNTPLFLPWVPFTTVLFFVLTTRYVGHAGPRRVARVAATGLVTFYLPQVAYQVVLFLLFSGRPVSDFVIELSQWPASYWLIDFTLYLMTFSVVYAVVALRAGLEHERRRQRLDGENLALRLEVERQRLQSLRAQLEPHFLFNALNAIGGLVRGGQSGQALTAMQQLSALLRYALSATTRTWVTIGDELAFIRGYVTLQQLRFGDRLTLTISGDSEAAREADCPPLLLQPLIENAIRHDLECHDLPGNITLTLSVRAERLQIEIVNSVRPGVSANPGLGLGLPSTRSRVTLLYGASAQVNAARTGDQFVVSINLPHQAPEAA
jgi:hypothetical protein